MQFQKIDEDAESMDYDKEEDEESSEETSINDAIESAASSQQSVDFLNAQIRKESKNAVDLLETLAERSASFREKSNHGIYEKSDSDKSRERTSTLTKEVQPQAESMHASNVMYESRGDVNNIYVANGLLNYTTDDNSSKQYSQTKNTSSNNNSFSYKRHLLKEEGSPKFKKQKQGEGINATKMLESVKQEEGEENTLSSNQTATKHGSLTLKNPDTNNITGDTAFNPRTTFDNSYRPHLSNGSSVKVDNKNYYNVSHYDKIFSELEFHFVAHQKFNEKRQQWIAKNKVHSSQDGNSSNQMALFELNQKRANSTQKNSVAGTRKITMTNNSTFKHTGSIVHKHEDQPNSMKEHFIQMQQDEIKESRSKMQTMA